MTDDATHLAVFAKYWQPGYVKTRLAASVGAAAAAELYRELLRATLGRFENRAQRCVLVYTPAKRRSEFAALLRGMSWELEPQSGGDLGERLWAHLARAVRCGARRLVVLGSDAPQVPPQRVAEAFALLGQHDAVLGPATDGGYYLLGCRAAEPEQLPPIFHDMPWSAATLLQRTQARLQAAGMAAALLDAAFDVDTLPDVYRLHRTLASESPGDVSLEPLRDAIAALIRCHPPPDDRPASD
jgi:rSAM/selenodomain-associated transferase 1